MHLEDLSDEELADLEQQFKKLHERLARHEHAKRHGHAPHHAA